MKILNVILDAIIDHHVGFIQRTKNNLNFYVCVLRYLRSKIFIHLLIVLSPICSYADTTYVNGPFFVREKYFDFINSISSRHCNGRIPYPVLSNDDQEFTAEINNEIHDFVELYIICNHDREANVSVKFDMPPSGSDDYFSIRWITKKDDKIYRIDSLNFDINNGNLLEVDDIFNPSSSPLLRELIKLSSGHLSGYFTWEQLLDKIGKREIQYYIKNKEWYIVFNANAKLNKVAEAKVPKYFLKSN